MPYADTGRGSLYYEIADIVAPWERPADTIVFHHGIGADPGIWADWLPVLAGRYRLVCFEMRGYGQSHIPASDFTWSLDMLADDVLAVADAAGAERFHLVGESIGGTIGLLCAIRYPGRIATLTVSNGAHLGASIKRAELWQRTIDERGIKAWSEQFMDDRFYPNAIDATRYAWFARQQERWGRDSILNALSVLIGADMRAQLGDIACPVLLLHGDSSPFIPVAVMADLHALLPQSRLKVFPRARHGLPFSHGRECAETLRGFLEATTNLSRSS